MKRADSVPLEIWLAVWKLFRRYHTYSVNETDLAKLADSRASLIVGYHGRPVPWDMCLLGLALYEKGGYLPAGITHRGLESIPPLRWMADGIHFFRGDGPELKKWVKAGRHVMVTPGGGRETGRSYRDRYRVNWGNHFGYLRLAIKYRLPIVPVGASGVDHAYIGLNNSSKLGARLGLPRELEPLPWFALGPLGLFPFSPPFPVRIHQLIGEPIVPRDEGVTNAKDEKGLGMLHEKVAGAVQRLLDRARLPAELRAEGD
jgi:1-acyl-sn-glycerol-3-phosphate acyltransferase